MEGWRYVWYCQYFFFDCMYIFSVKRQHTSACIKCILHIGRNLNLTTTCVKILHRRVLQNNQTFISNVKVSNWLFQLRIWDEKKSRERNLNNLQCFIDITFCIIKPLTLRFLRCKFKVLFLYLTTSNKTFLEEMLLRNNI
jgi:hypothetical protein